MKWFAFNIQLSIGSTLLTILNECLLFVLSVLTMIVPHLVKVMICEINYRAIYQHRTWQGRKPSAIGWQKYLSCLTVCVYLMFSQIHYIVFLLLDTLFASNMQMTYKCVRPYIYCQQSSPRRFNVPTPLYFLLASHFIFTSTLSPGQTSWLTRKRQQPGLWLSLTCLFIRIFSDN